MPDSNGPEDKTKGKPTDDPQRDQDQRDTDEYFGGSGGTGSTDDRSVIGRVFSAIYDWFHALFTNPGLRWARLGLLVGVGAFGIFELVNHLGGSSSSANNQTALKTKLAQSGQILQTMGVPQKDIQVLQNQVLLTRGMSIVTGSAKGTAGRDEKAGNNSPVFVTNSLPPSAYANLASFNADNYLNAFTKKLSNQTIVANSAVVHNANETNR